MGSNLPISFPKRELGHLAYLGFTTAISGCVALSTLDGLLWLSVALGCFAACYGLLSIVNKPRLLTAPGVLSTSLLLAYFVGYSLYLITVMLFGADRLPAWYVDSYGSVSDHWLNVASAVVLVVAFCLRGLGLLAAPLLQDHNGHKPTMRFDVVGLWIGLAIVVTAYLGGGVGYGGIQPRAGGQISGLAALAMTIAVPLAVTAFWFTLSARSTKRWQCLAVFFIAELLVVPLGRREVLFSLVLIAILWSLRSQTKRFNIVRSIRWAAVGSVAVVLVILPAFTAFYALREYKNSGEQVEASQSSTATMVTGAARLVSEDTYQVFYSQLTNIGPRGGSLLAYLGDNLQRHHPLMGDVLTFSFQMVIPSKFWKQKQSVIDATDGQSESLIHPQLGLPVYDGPNSLLTEGYADFGLIGAIAYSVVLALLFGLFVSLVVRRANDVGGMLTIVAVLYSLLSVEKSLTGYLVDLRHIVLLYCAFAVFSILYRQFFTRRAELAMPMLPIHHGTKLC